MKTEKKEKKNVLINLERVNCPECGLKQPELRLPKNANEAIWGGWTCKNCGCKMDRFGKIR